MNPHVVHRDIKASNILLDGDLTPKISDFGLAKLFPENATHISTRVAGTLGHLAPEYAVTGRLTRKSDVYSFGVLVLEILETTMQAKPKRRNVTENREGVGGDELVLATSIGNGEDLAPLVRHAFEVAKPETLLHQLKNVMLMSLRILSKVRISDSKKWGVLFF